MKRIFWLDVARVFAIISVSLNHAVNRTYDNYINTQLEFQQSAMYSSCLKAGISVFSRLGVPIFLMISGALLLNKVFNDETDIKKFYKHNLLGLFVTSEIWFFIMFWILAFCSPENGYLIENIRNGEWGETVISLIKTLCFIDPITLGNMWYIPMILCIYAILPVVAVFLQKMKSKLMFIPLGVCGISAFVVPNINALLSIRGIEKQYTFTLSAVNLFSMYLIYVIIGYLINQKILAKISTGVIVFVIVGSFVFNFVSQLYAYAGPTNYLVSYDFSGIVVCSAFLFELFRRKADLLKKLGEGGYNIYQELHLECFSCMQ